MIDNNWLMDITIKHLIENDLIVPRRLGIKAVGYIPETNDIGNSFFYLWSDSKGRFFMSANRQMLTQAMLILAFENGRTVSADDAKEPIDSLCKFVLERVVQITGKEYVFKESAETESPSTAGSVMGTAMKHFVENRLLIPCPIGKYSSAECLPIDVISSSGVIFYYWHNTTADKLILSVNSTLLFEKIIELCRVSNVPASNAEIEEVGNALYMLSLSEFSKGISSMP